MDGILCINKPPEFTSFDVIAKLRGMSKTKRVGHSGTLDPMATGVLPIFFGIATKACDMMPSDKKEYIAEFKLGYTSDTLDTHGTITTLPQSHITKEQIIEQLNSFLGDIKQIPPMYSAVRVNGQRLYDIARQGIEIKREPRDATIYEIELISFDETAQTGFFRMACSKGTYVRTICDDMGKNLECGCIMGELVRTISNGFTLDECYTLEQVQQMVDEQTLEPALMPIEKLFMHLPKIKLNEIQTIKFCNGVKLDLNRVHHKDIDGLHKVLSHEGKFLAVASLDKENMILKVEKRFGV